LEVKNGDFMKFKFYQKLLNILLLLITLIYLLKIYFGFNEWSPDKNLIFKVMFYSPVILSLLCLYLSIYAYILKVEFVHNLRRKVTTINIVFSSICLIFSLSPAFWVYLSSLNSDIDYANMTKLYEIDDINLDENGMAKNKYEAQDYYRKTNKLVKYFDEDGNESLYPPDESDGIYFQSRQLIEILKLRQVLMNKSANNLIIITIISIILFVMFLVVLVKHFYS
jgi:hypothetical protein